VTIIEDATWDWKEDSKREGFDLSFADPFPFIEGNEGTPSSDASDPTSTNEEPVMPLHSPGPSTGSHAASIGEQTPTHEMSHSTGTTLSPVTSSASSSQSPLNVRSLSDIYASTHPLEPDDYLHLQFALNICDPLCYEEAAQEKKLQIDMAEELASIERNGT
jgi:hypothetical protein